MPYRHDLEADTLTEEELAAAAQPPVSRASAKELRIQGPFPCCQYQLACRLPGKALSVWQLVQHVQRLNRTQGAVTLPDTLTIDYGISADAKQRAVRLLSQVGLLSVVYQG